MISNQPAGAIRVGDLDGDGDTDTLLSDNSGGITWHENLGSGAFGPGQMIIGPGEAIEDAQIADLNGDGDLDVLWGGQFSIKWHRNPGGGNFGGPRWIGSTQRVFSVHAADLDGDGDAEVLSGEFTGPDQELFFHENLSTTCGFPLGTSYCAANPNSTGAEAFISATGCDSVSENEVTLASAPVPNTPGIFFYGTHQSQLPFGNGFRCVSGSIHRLPPVVAVGNEATYELDFPNLPFPIVDGDTWNFQHWFRDPGFGAEFNTSNGLEITFSL